MRTRRDRNTERGNSKLNALIVFAILGCLAFAAFQIAPPLMAKFQLQDTVTSEARFAVATHKPEDQIRAEIMRKIAELEIPAGDYRSDAGFHRRIFRFRIRTTRKLAETRRRRRRQRR